MKNEIVFNYLIEEGEKLVELKIYELPCCVVERFRNWIKIYEAWVTKEFEYNLELFNKFSDIRLRPERPAQPTAYIRMLHEMNICRKGILEFLKVIQNL